MKIILSFIFLFNTVAYAQCPEDVQIIAEGDIANCSGFLFSPEAEQKANEVYDERDMLLEESKLLKRKVSLTEEQNAVLERRLRLHMEQSEVLAKQVVRKENMSEWNKVLYFGLGVLATGLAVNAAKGL